MLTVSHNANLIHHSYLNHDLNLSLNLNLKPSCCPKMAPQLYGLAKMSLILLRRPPLDQRTSTKIVLILHVTKSLLCHNVLTSLQCPHFGQSSSFATMYKNNLTSLKLYYFSAISSS